MKNSGLALVYAVVAFLAGLGLSNAQLTPSVRTLLDDGSISLKGNWLVDAGVTIDGVDISESIVSGTDDQTVAFSGTTLTAVSNLVNDGTNVRVASGNLLSGTTVTTGAAVADIVLANTKYVRFINAAGSTSANFGMGGTNGDDLQLDVPAATDLYIFRFGGAAEFDIRGKNGSALLLWRDEASGDPGSEGANTAQIYTKDNGAGKTQLCAQFNSGVDCFAIEP